MPEIKTSYPQEPVLLEDRYPATLKEVSEYTATYEGKETEKLAWIFDVEAPEDAIDPDVEIEIEDWEYSGKFEVARHTSYATGPKSNLRPLLEALLGEVPKKLNTDDLIGLPAMVYVVSYETKGGQTANVIEKVSPPKKEQKAGKPKTKTQAQKIEEAKNADIDESDFDDIPFGN
jgi:hypothetical protein